MRILVDADACPVKGIIVEIAKKNKISVIMIIDTSHKLNDGYSEVITVDTAKDSADIKLINLSRNGDIVVTQDFGVAAMAIGKGAFAINQNGMVYSEENMDRLLFERHIGQKVRRAGGRGTSMKKRTSADDLSFETAFIKLLETAFKAI